MISEEWHRAHRMPRNATHEQRVAWHLEHSEACACRQDLPPSVAEDVERLRAERGMPPLGHPDPARP